MDEETAAEPTSWTWPPLPDLLIYAVPALVAIVLSLPCFYFTYQWDDYDFLTNALLDRSNDLLPDPADPFYRPISRGVYFLILSMTGGHDALLGHALNALFLIGVVLMVVRLTRRAAGSTAGLLAGITFAGLGVLPTLVGWVCCDQDLLSMLFVLVALDLQWSGRWKAALAAAIAALLSKETAIAVVPVLVFMNWVLKRRPYRIVRNVVAYGLVVALWAAVHPAVRVLLSRGLMGGATGYVGLQHPEQWPVHFGRYLLTMFNIPVSATIPPWPGHLTALLAIAIGLAAWGLVRTVREAGEEDTGQAADGGAEGDADDELETEPDKEAQLQGDAEVPVPLARCLLLAALLSLSPLILTSVIIRNWAPYYSAFPSMGLAMLSGMALARVSTRTTLGVLIAFFVLGVWSREGELAPVIATEKAFRRTSPALEQVYINFKKLVRDFPAEPQVLVSVEARGNAGVYTHIYTFGVMRVWYQDLRLRVRKPEDRIRSQVPDLLFVVTPNLDVIQIDPGTLAVRSASGREPDYAYVEGAVRAYCTGLFGSGDVDRAVGILLHMPEINPRLQSLHRRIAATYLISDGRAADADSVLQHSLPLDRGLALADLRAVLAQPPAGRILDAAALQAFGIGQDDSSGMRDLMRWFSQMKYAEPAIRFAERLRRLVPGDPEADATIGRMNNLLEERRKAPLAPGELSADSRRPHRLVRAAEHNIERMLLSPERIAA